MYSTPIKFFWQIYFLKGFYTNTFHWSLRCIFWRERVEVRYSFSINSCKIARSNSKVSKTKSKWRRLSLRKATLSFVVPEPTVGFRGLSEARFSQGYIFWIFSCPGDIYTASSITFKRSLQHDIWLSNGRLTLFLQIKILDVPCMSHHLSLAEALGILCQLRSIASAYCAIYKYIIYRPFPKRFRL